MKYLIVITSLLTGITASSQVIIGDAVGSAANKSSVLLEFAAGQNKGIILPYVKTMPTGSAVTPGTLLLDASNSLSASVKLYKSSGWVDLSSGYRADVHTEMLIQDDAPVESSTAKTIIGAKTATADGVLVLESASHAMVLPIVSSTNDVINPSPGMLVYVNKAGAKRLAVFNGAVWAYWKK